MTWRRRTYLIGSTTSFHMQLQVRWHRNQLLNCMEWNCWYLAHHRNRENNKKKNRNYLKDHLMMMNWMSYWMKMKSNLILFNHNGMWESQYNQMELYWERLPMYQQQALKMITIIMKVAVQIHNTRWNMIIAIALIIP